MTWEKIINFIFLLNVINITLNLQTVYIHDSVGKPEYD